MHIQPSRTAKTIGVGLLAIAAVACGVSPDDDREAIERDLFEESTGAELFTVIRDTYPGDVEVLVSQIQQVPTAQRNGERGKELSAAWLQDFMTRIAPDAIKAPADPLLVWSAAEAELYETLQRSATEACATMTMGGWVSVDEENIAAQAAIQRRNTAMVKAAAAGRDDPQDYAEPSEADLNRLGISIAATGIDPDLQALLGRVPEMQALAPSEQCQLGVAFYQGISDLPDDIEPGVAAYMFAPE